MFSSLFRSFSLVHSQTPRLTLESSVTSHYHHTPFYACTMPSFSVHFVFFSCPPSPCALMHLNLSLHRFCLHPTLTTLESLAVAPAPPTLNPAAAPTSLKHPWLANALPARHPSRPRASTIPLARLPPRLVSSSKQTNIFSFLARHNRLLIYQSIYPVQGHFSSPLLLSFCLYLVHFFPQNTLSTILYLSLSHSLSLLRLVTVPFFVLSFHQGYVYQQHPTRHSTEQLENGSVIVPHRHPSPKSRRSFNHSVSIYRSTTLILPLSSLCLSLSSKH